MSRIQPFHSRADLSFRMCSNGYNECWKTTVYALLCFVPGLYEKMLDSGMLRSSDDDDRELADNLYAMATEKSPRKKMQVQCDFESACLYAEKSCERLEKYGCSLPVTRVGISGRLQNASIKGAARGGGGGDFGVRIVDFIIPLQTRNVHGARMLDMIQGGTVCVIAHSPDHFVLICRDPEDSLRWCCVDSLSKTRFLGHSCMSMLEMLVSSHCDMATVFLCMSKMVESDTFSGWCEWYGSVCNVV